MIKFMAKAKYNSTDKSKYKSKYKYNYKYKVKIKKVFYKYFKELYNFFTTVFLTTIRKYPNSSTLDMMLSDVATQGDTIYPFLSPIIDYLGCGHVIDTMLALVKIQVGTT